jgi:hypothetical protein
MPTTQHLQLMHTQPCKQQLHASHMYVGCVCRTVRNPHNLQVRRQQLKHSTSSDWQAHTLTHHARYGLHMSAWPSQDSNSPPCHASVTASAPAVPAEANCAANEPPRNGKAHRGGPYQVTVPIAVPASHFAPHSRSHHCQNLAKHKSQVSHKTCCHQMSCCWLSHVSIPLSDPALQPRPPCHAMLLLAGLHMVQARQCTPQTICAPVAPPLLAPSHQICCCCCLLTHCPQLLLN